MPLHSSMKSKKYDLTPLARRILGFSTMRRRPRGVLPALLVLATLGCEGRPSRRALEDGQELGGPSIASIDLSHGAPEVAPHGLLGLQKPGQSFYDLLQVTRNLRTSTETRGVFVRFGGELGFARSLEVGRALGALRKAGKRIACHADGLTNGLMIVAAMGCDSISIPPAGSVETVGIGAQIIYLRRLLSEELKLSIDILQVGKFKGAEEPVTRDGPSDEARASLEGVLADLRKHQLNAVTGARTGADVRAALEDGPFAPDVAKARGLIDEIQYEDDARNALKKATGAVRIVPAFGHSGAASTEHDGADLVRALAGEPSGHGPVAILRAIGSITMGDDGGASPFGGTKDGITETGLGRQVAQLEADDSVKAVVLRIDSPGGSALASDLLWHRLMALRKKKKLVISVGDMAASGGYYLACTGDRIFAEPVSIVGSIGVVGGKIGIGTALERFGIHAETFPAKKDDPIAKNRVAYMSTFVPWDDATKARVRASMEGVYTLFLARISEGRSLPVDQIAASAEGRIFSGEQALARKLVDELGGLTEAVSAARQLAGLPADARAVLVEPTGGLLQSLAGDDLESRAKASAGSLLPDQLAQLRVLAPGVVSYVRALTPLAEGERMATTMPFAVTIR
jgi:protease IV